MSTPMQHDEEAARETIAHRRKDRTRKRNRTYTAKQQRIRAAYARSKRQNHRPDWNALKRFNAATRRGEAWLTGKGKPGSLGGTILIRPSFCSLCGRHGTTQKIEGHHFNGYTPESALLASIVWCCRHCHSSIHARMSEAQLLGHDPNDGFREFVMLMREWSIEHAERFSKLPALPAAYNVFSGANPLDETQGGQ